MLGFPLTSSRLASSQVEVTLELEICYMRLRFLSASGVRVSLASFFSWTAFKLDACFYVSALQRSIDDEDRPRLQLLPDSSPLLLTNHSGRALTDNGLLLPPLASGSAA